MILSNPATINLLVLLPTICQASPKNHSTVSVFIVHGPILVRMSDCVQGIEPCKREGKGIDSKGWTFRML
jgi:hypothetical protein